MIEIRQNTPENKTKSPNAAIPPDASSGGKGKRKLCNQTAPVAIKKAIANPIRIEITALTTVRRSDQVLIAAA
jgi:hypothetical protein